MGIHHRQQVPPIHWARAVGTIIVVSVLVVCCHMAGKDDMETQKVIMSEQEKEQVFKATKKQQDRDDRAALHFYNKWARGEK